MHVKEEIIENLVLSTELRNQNSLNTYFENNLHCLPCYIECESDTTARIESFFRISPSDSRGMGLNASFRGRILNGVSFELKYKNPSLGAVIDKKEIITYFDKLILWNLEDISIEQQRQLINTLSLQTFCNKIFHA